MTDIVDKLHKLIEAKDKHISELIQENCALIRRYPNDDLIERQSARIAALEAALKPFVDAGALKSNANTGTLYEHTVWNICVTEAKLRAARAAMEGKDD